MFRLTCFECKKVLLETEGMGDDLTVCDECLANRKKRQEKKQIVSDVCDLGCCKLKE